MSEPMNNKTHDEPQAFLSLVTMREAHRELLEARREDGDSLTFLTAVQDFLFRGQEAGAYLDKEADREAAQSMLDYWENYLFHAGLDPNPTFLADFDITRAPEIPESKRPYVGLEAFQITDKNRFFGRSRLVQTLLQKIQEARFLAVVGPSGSGKSSVVMAGLLPALQKGSIPGSDQWRTVGPIVPGSAPLTSLARAFQTPEETADDWFMHTTTRLAKNPQYLTELADARQQTVVLVIDQFEELFTLCHDLEERQAFIDNIINLAQGRTYPHRVIVTMRTDYESYLNKYPLLQRLFEQGMVRVTAMAAGELREAIEGPAEAIGLKFDEGLVDQLVREILGEPAALPLLQFALLKLWQNREHNRITWNSYRKVGSVMQALANTADEVYDALIPEEKETAKRIFLRVVRPSAGLEVTRNRVPRKALYRSGEAKDRVDRVLQKLVDANLIHLTKGTSDDDDQIEVAHEALVRNWPRLVDWLNDERGRLRQRYRLANLAAEWDQRGRDPEMLIRGEVLREARLYDDLNEVEAAFVTASVAAEEALARKEEEQRQRELEQARQLAAEKEKARRRLAYLAAALVMAVIGLVVALVLFANIASLREAADAAAIRLLEEENEKLSAEATSRALASTSTVEARQAQATIDTQAQEATIVMITSTSEAATREVAQTTATAEYAISQEQVSQRATTDAIATDEAFQATATVQRMTVEAQVATATAVSVEGPSSVETPQLTIEERMKQYGLAAAANSYVRPKDSMTMLFITGDTFVMGEDERSGVKAKVDSFYIDQFEVTVQQYADFLNSIGGYRENCGDGSYCVLTKYETQYTFLLNNLGIYEASAGFANYPINWVTWAGANDYCAWAHEGGRLPTAAEWEYAARGLDGRPYPWGDDSPAISLAAFGQRLQEFSKAGPMFSVDALPDGVSPFGVYAMSGNVAEWVLPVDDDGEVKIDDDDATQFLRGGSWASDKDEIFVYTAVESPLFFPLKLTEDEATHWAGAGFRCAADVDTIPSP